MELAAEEPGVVRRFDDFHVIFVGSAASNSQARRDERFFVLAIELVTMGGGAR